MAAHGVLWFSLHVLLFKGLSLTWTLKWFSLWYLVFLFVCFRFKDIDPETGCETQEQKFSHDRRDVYPLHVIPENQDGIQGSCVFFKERKNVTKQIRSKSFAPLVNLEEAQERSVRFNSNSWWWWRTYPKAEKIVRECGCSYRAWFSWRSLFVKAERFLFTVTTCLLRGGSCTVTDSINLPGLPYINNCLPMSFQPVLH